MNENMIKSTLNIVNIIPLEFPMQRYTVYAGKPVHVLLKKGHIFRYIPLEKQSEIPVHRIKTVYRLYRYKRYTSLLYQWKPLVKGYCREVRTRKEIFFFDGVIVSYHLFIKLDMNKYVCMYSKTLFPNED